MLRILFLQSLRAGRFDFHSVKTETPFRPKAGLVLVAPVSRPRPGQEGKSYIAARTGSICSDASG